MPLRPSFITEVTVNWLSWKKKGGHDLTESEWGPAAILPSSCRSCSSTSGGASLPRRAEVFPDCHLLSQRGVHCWQQGPAQQPELSWTSGWKTSLTTGGHGAESIYMMRRRGRWRDLRSGENAEMKQCS